MRQIVDEPPAAWGDGARRAARGLARQLVLKAFSKIEVGRLVLIDGADRRSFGRRESELDLVADIEVLDGRFYTELVRGGKVGFGEGFVRGWWRSSDLVGLHRLALRNLEMRRDVESSWTSELSRYLATPRRSPPNTRVGARTNIKAHYDLGNELFAHILDPTMSYSAAYFEHHAQTLEEASRAKMDRICRKLDLGPEHHVLELGCGWGGFAIHAAERYGCRVTATTISQSQWSYAVEQVRRRGLQDRVTLLLEDYRDLHGVYDRLVSIEMLEAVGVEFLSDFLRVCQDRLSPEGALLLQFITIDGCEYDEYLASDDFIRRHVFPGSCLLSLSALSELLTRTTDLRVVEVDDITAHYAPTLRAWRENLHAERAALASLGHDEAFLRRWEYYFALCEAGFAEHYIGDVQLTAARPAAPLALRRP